MTLAELKAQVTRLVKRADLAAQIPTYLSLAEKDYNLRTSSAYDLTDQVDAAESWLSINAPLVYVYGAMVQFAIDTQDDNALQKYAILYERMADLAHYADVKESGVMDEQLTPDFTIAVQANILTGDA